MKVAREKESRNAVQHTRNTIRKKMFGYIAAGFGLVAGLAWNDAVKLIIDSFIPDKGNTIVAKVAYAVIITVVVGVVLFYMERSSDEDKT